MGQLLRQLGSGRQVLCVTHLPQVAARGHQHLRVLKQSNPDDATPVSQLQGLTNEDRVDEIARMLGDEGAQKTSREHARSLVALSCFKRRIPTRSVRAFLIDAMRVEGQGMILELKPARLGDLVLQILDL